MAIKDDNVLQIELVYAGVDNILRIPLQVTEGTTIRQALALSGMLEQCPEIDPERNKLGIFSKLCDPDTVVAAGDRVEVYRPVTADPKQARRRRASLQQSGNK
jgi:hypothetical protein